MKITRKFTMGYVVLILIPVIAFGFHYYIQIYGGLKIQFVESRQRIVEQAYGNMKMDFSRIQSIHRIMQYNSNVTDFLDGVYISEAENVYSFNKYIQPLFAQSLFANREIESLVVYKTKEEVFSIPDYFISASVIPLEVKRLVAGLKPGIGVWVSSQIETQRHKLIYYQNIYNSQFTEIIGLLEIKVNETVFDRFYEAAHVEEPWIIYYLPNSEKVIEQSSIKLEHAFILDQFRSCGTCSSLYRNNYVVNQLFIEELDLIVIVIGEIDEVFYSFSKTDILITFTLVLILVALSLGYYAISSSISKRILRLARNMRNIDEENFKLNIVKKTKAKQNDEIGFLIETYNSMLYRMDELVNNVHRIELLNKEAKYKVLQAQIKPHFLYNTLETIRMLAETNNDQEVADISFWFGKLMRYSLSSDDDVTTLAQEIEMAKFFLKIHKIRLQDRLDFKFDILLNNLDIKVPRFILQPLIENSIVHGVSTVIRPVLITITAFEMDSELHILIKDTGAGIAKDKLIKLQEMLLMNGSTKGISQNYTSVGLSNVNNRIKAFFGEESRVEIESEEGEITVLDVVIVRRRADI